MRRLRPEDDYFIRLETDETPHHIGALQLFDLAGRSPDAFCTAVRDHLEIRLPDTPLLSRLRHSPFFYDADVWLDVARCDLDEHIERIAGDRAALFMMVHHAVGDGISFQNIMSLLTDESPTLATCV